MPQIFASQPLESQILPGHFLLKKHEFVPEQIVDRVLDGNYLVKDVTIQELLPSYYRTSWVLYSPEEFKEFSCKYETA